VPAPDWSALFASRPNGASTEVVAVDASTGAERVLSELPGPLQTRVVSPSGRLVALADPHPPGASLYLPGGREQTTIVVADTAGQGEPLRFELAGNYEPEAFSSDDRYLFVIEYLPAMQPDRYRVRELDLATGRIASLGARVKAPPPPEEEMRGVGRQQLMAHTGTALYTLYTRQPDHLHARELAAGTVRPSGSQARAFVHILSLAQGWAFCLDLPHPFGQGSPDSVAMALSPDGQRLYVVDRSSGLLAVADTGARQVVRTVDIGADEHLHGTTATRVAPDGSRLYVAGGSRIRVIDTATQAVSQQWAVAGQLSGLGLSPDGRSLYVGLADGVAVLDAVAGRERQRLPAQDVQSIEHVAMPLQADATR
jgi:YVTN family beta-propeller protein